MKQTEILTHATHVNAWFPAVYMSRMSQNFRLFHVSNLSVRNFRFFSAHVYGTISANRLIPVARRCRPEGGALVPGRGEGPAADAGGCGGDAPAPAATAATQTADHHTVTGYMSRKKSKV